MKLKTNSILKSVAIIVVAIMLTIPLALVAFAENTFISSTQTESLVDVLGLREDESTEVIVQFTSPSLLELNVEADSAYAEGYEQMLVSEQNAVLNKYGIIPRYRYTSVLNAVAVTVTGEKLRALENEQGVEGVYLPERYEAPEVDEGLHTYADATATMIGATPFVTDGYTGDGVVVAVVDSGMDLNHEAFNNTKYVSKPTLTAEKLVSLGFATAGYHNEKIPFYYDYINSTTTDFGDARGHGSHVGGIIGGYVENGDGTVKFSGIAPGVQLCAMRMLDDKGVGTQDALFAALEDAYKLDVDIINLSLGRDSGFRRDNAHYLSHDGIFSQLEEAGIMVICAAGNSSGMHINTAQRLLDNYYADYGTLGSPAVYDGNVGVGSVDNLKTTRPMITINGESFPYSDNSGNKRLLNFMERFDGKAMDIVYSNTYGKEEDYETLDVKGKLVAVHRGELSFTDKCKYATAAGASGLIVINYEGQAVAGMTIENQAIPAILVNYGIVEHLPATNCVLDLEISEVVNPSAGAVSYFSSIGVTPDLEIGLDIMGVGGGVLSVEANTNDGYVVKSGTSMASPCVAGAYALLYERLITSGAMDEMGRVGLAEYMDKVTQSTATILTYTNGYYYYSPRFQGAGLIDINAALAAEAYVDNPIVCLGDDANASGRVSVEYELVSRTTAEKKYYVLPSMIIDAFTQISESDYRNSIAPMMFSPSDYTFKTYVDGVEVADSGEITLPAGESVSVRVELELLPYIAERLLSIYPNGYFLDGFIEFYDVENLSKSAMHGSFVSFMGDWLAAPAIEPLTEIELLEWLYENGMEQPYESLFNFQTMYPNANFSYTTLLLGEELEYHIGQNPLDAEQYYPQNPDRYAVSSAISNADKVIYDRALLKPSFLRNCRSVEYVVTNSQTGEVYITKTQEYVSKDVYVSNNEYFSMSELGFTGTYMAVNEWGEMVEKYIPSGTDVTISVYTLLDHPDATERLEVEYEFTMDYVAPEFYYEYDADTKQLTLTCSDGEYLAGVLLQEMTEAFTFGDTVELCLYADDTPGVMHTEVFDLSDYEGDSIGITVSDYASNMVTMVLSLSNGSVSNIEGEVTIGDGLSVDFVGEPYIYQEVEFTVTPAEGYCFTEDFAIMVNGEELTHDAVENGTYSYSVILTEEELVINAVGVMQHDFQPTVWKEATCVCEGELAYVCSNCSCVDRVESISASGHERGDAVTIVEATCTDAGIATVSCSKCGVVLETQTFEAHGHTACEPEIVKEATCVESGLSIVRCADCESILEAKIIPATGHDHTTGDKATAFSPAVCGICGESYGATNSNGVIVLSIVLSSVAILASAVTAILFIIKRKR